MLSLHGTSEGSSNSKRVRSVATPRCQSTYKASHITVLGQEILELMRGYTLWHPFQAAGSDIGDVLDSKSVEKHLSVLGWNNDAGSRVARLKFFGLEAERVQPEFREPAAKVSQPQSLPLNAFSASSRNVPHSEPRTVMDLRNGTEGLVQNNELQGMTETKSSATQV